MKVVVIKYIVCHLILISPLITHAQLMDTNLHESLHKTESDDCPSGSEDIAAQNSDWEHEVIELINLERQDEGLPPLKINDGLMRSARYHSKAMADHVFFDHDSHNADGSVTCQSTDRIGSFYDYIAMGENIAYGQTTPQIVVNEWINSSSHYTNIINSEYKETGAGYYPSSSYMRHLWTQDFGNRSNVYPVVINNEAYATHQLEVDLYIYGDGEFDQMRIKNESGTWTDWMPFQSTLTWQISGASNCTVYVERKNGNSTTNSASDEIFYAHGSTATKPGLDETAQDNKINHVNLFPNPLKKGTELSIRLEVTQKTDLIIEIFDIHDKTTGTILHTGTFNPGKEHKIKVQTRFLPAGIYFVQLRDKEFKRVETLLIVNG